MFPLHRPVLYSMLIYTATTGSTLIGMKTMFLFSIGLAVPYLLVGYYMPEAINVIKKTKKYQNIISIILGTFLIFLGFLTTLGKIQDLTTFLSRLLPFKLPLGM